MKKNDTSFEELIIKALENAIDDRERAVDAYEKTKGIYDVDLESPDPSKRAESLQGLMLLGQNVSKILEICQKSNEQIIKLAQIREKEISNKKEKKESRGPINLEELRDIVKKNDNEGVN